MTRRWAWVVALVGGVALLEIVRRVLIDTPDPNLVPSLILLGAAAAPAAFALSVISLGLLTWCAHQLARGSRVAAPLQA